jgi:hypothetical protein
MSITKLSAKQLRRAAGIREKIDALEAKLAGILPATDGASVPARRRPGRPRKVGRPAKPAPVAALKPKRRMSKAARAKQAERMRKRWAKAKAAGKTSL